MTTKHQPATPLPEMAAYAADLLDIWGDDAEQVRSHMESEFPDATENEIVAAEAAALLRELGEE